MTQDELARSIGGTKSTISRIESGDRDVKSGELADIADTLGVSMRDLLGRRKPLPPLALAHRLGEAQLDSPSAVEATRHLGHLLEITALLDELEIPEPSSLTPTLLEYTPVTADPKRAGEELASKVRTDLALGHQPARGLDVLVEQWFGIDVVGLPLGDGEDTLSGMCVKTPALRAALLNTSKWLTHQRFTLAHELAHVLFGDPTDEYHVDTHREIFGSDAREVRANAFAAELLLPKAALEAWVRAASGVTEAVFTHLLFTYRVSVAVLAIRLHGLGFITEEERESYRAQSPALLARRHNRLSDYLDMAAERDVSRPPTRLYERAVAAYCDARIGIGPLAGILRRDESELREELAEEGFTPDFKGHPDVLALL